MDSFLRKISAWLCLYLIGTGILAILLGILLSVYSAFPSDVLGRLVLISYVTASLMLIGIGITSSLPISEYVYMRQSGLNPPMTREGRQQVKRRPERREVGIILGLAGFTSAIGLNPWLLLMFYVVVPLAEAIQIGTILFAAVLAFLIIVYKKQLHQYINSNAERSTQD